MNIDLTRLFVKVIQNGSFSRAADILGIPKSTVSKSVSRLERESGTKLITRTTRSLTLTAAGRVFYESCLGPIQTIEDAQKSLQGKDSIVSGLVRITAPEDLGTYVIAPTLAPLAIKHPNLRFELQYTDDVIDLVKDGFDVAIRIGKIRASSFKIKRLGEVTLVAVASPSYLKSRDRIRVPKDLEKQSCLGFTGLLDGTWHLRRGDSSARVKIRSNISTNQMTGLVKLAVADGGVALVPSYLCKTEIENGALVRVLPEWSSPGMPVSIITPLAPSSSARLRITVDLLYSAVLKTLK